jgi:hypothetical protein
MTETVLFKAQQVAGKLIFRSLIVILAEAGIQFF